ncbi:hypothetical protein SEA_EMMA1919_220 [Streptomyces phage Emma1919]|uniref:Uncharacterized protein n=2 Tax=Gilsonvirus gilson TaxID=2846398 RepID=A0A3T0ID01_9CAUD|nr:hypothetical protein HWB98_gp067 [Streptomyces phage Gilson]AZU97262.1 hypothetical protein SEA_GILSON_217 [Streptomyces phage Gilson]QQV92559.1 hypothetical protein SEA_MEGANTHEEKILLA_222 [Streptomyces phage MeganTheeKilla]QZE11552.1 hypothetical protein SEA_JADA_219 [Streptomyces phage Jada]URQ04801.1 hypothetical protein SEA_EMMA1919_220 [Streptomyces phage Emma1919]
MFDGPRRAVDPTGVRLSDANHREDRLYRLVSKHLLNGLENYTFNVQTFANFIVKTSPDVIKSRLMQLALAIADACADEYKGGNMTDGPINGMRVQEAVQVYNIPRG